MSRPQYVNLNCPYYGHEWLEPVVNLLVLAAEAVIYKDDDENETVRRRVLCPNCDKSLSVPVPQEWLDDE